MSTKTKVSDSNLRSNIYDDVTHELENYKLLVESVQDYAIFLMDTKGYIKTWNKGAEKNKGYKAKEIIGRHFSTFYRQVDLDADKPAKELQIALKFGRAEDEDWRVRKDGSLFWASVVITTLYDKHGRHIGFAKVTRDLTERKKYEDELREANTLLKKQRLELEIINNSKDEFISLASHQLRTPATITKQLLGLYAEGFFTDIDEKHIERIKKAYYSNERQIDIVNSLLKVAMVDSGKLDLAFDEVDVVQLVQKCVEELKGSAYKKNQELSVVHHATSVVMRADKKNLRMAIENIINNAIKYTYAKGMIEVRITEDGNDVRILVSDNGVGIAKADINKLFKKFSRIPNDLSGIEGGTGLGLYWSHKIIVMHKGEVEVESKPYEGTIFTIILPKQ